MKNKTGADKFLSVYWFFIIFLVAGGIVFMAAQFYGSPYDVREIEARILEDRIADCLTNRGYFDSSALNENFMQNCNLVLDTEDFSDWKENGQYYFEVGVNGFDSHAPNNLGQRIFDFSAGNINLKTEYVVKNPEKERVGRNIDTIVIHFTASSNLRSAQIEFENTHKGIHYLIDKDGTIVPGDTPLGDVAIHTNSVDINSRSIGIEIVNLGDMCSADYGYCNWNTGTCKQICQDAGNGEEVNGIVWEKFTPEQITSVKNLISELVSKYDIPADREHILAHSQIDTKTRVDPGPLFPWDDVMNSIVKQESPQLDLGIERGFYAIDSSNNKYIIKILTFVGKVEKNA